MEKLDLKYSLQEKVKLDAAQEISSRFLYILKKILIQKDFFR